MRSCSHFLRCGLQGLCLAPTYQPSLITYHWKWAIDRRVDNKGNCLSTEWGTETCEAQRSGSSFRKRRRFHLVRGGCRVRRCNREDRWSCGCCVGVSEFDGLERCCRWEGGVDDWCPEKEVSVPESKLKNQMGLNIRGSRPPLPISLSGVYVSSSPLGSPPTSNTRLHPC